MSDQYTNLLDTADRIAAADLYPARLRTVIHDLSAALRETSALLAESRDYGSALVEELRARTEKLDQLLLLANSMDADFESYTKVHPAVQPDAAVLKERERCAKVAEGVAWWAAGDTAAMIRKGESND